MSAALHVYFIQPIDGGLVKIGVTNRPLRRLAALNGSSPVLLRILALIPDAGRAGEARLHQEFDCLRVRHEWFRPEPPLLDHIHAHGMAVETWLRKAEADAEIERRAAAEAERIAAEAKVLAEERRKTSPQYRILRNFSEVAETYEISLPSLIRDARSGAFEHVKFGRARGFTKTQLPVALARYGIAITDADAEWSATAFPEAVTTPT